MAKRIPPFGIPAPCPPIQHPLSKDGMVAWSWFPAWSWLAILLVISSLLMIFGLVLTIVRILSAGLPMLFIGAIATFVLGNWKWNADKQMAYQLARGKSVQAIELWTEIDEMFYYQAKDTFFETRYGGKTLRVLRDGTIEIQGCHNDVDTGAVTKAAVSNSMKVSSGEAF